MAEFCEVRIKRILNQTSIDLGEYVINPFMGCEFACLYCYVRSNRVVSRKNKPWGEYVDVRVNAAALLEKEIAARKPKTVLLGSTTECFQPIEKKYRLVAKILQTLNKHKTRYVILTRSPLIMDYLPLLREGFCEAVYFTINKFSDAFKMRLEPKSPAFALREEAVRTLLSEGIPVIPYFSPVLPWISDVKDIFLRFEQSAAVEFECLNFRLNNTEQILNAIGAEAPAVKARYERMKTDRAFYAEVWNAFKREINRQAALAKKRYTVYVHSFGGYFNNTYTTAHPDA